jgi:two-component system OmpR family response regulator
VNTPSPPPSKAAHLLLVEDDPEVRAGLEDYFSHAGYEVSSVETGTEVLPAIRSKAPDLVILDIRLPDADGFEVLRAVREAGMEVPIFVLTVLRRSAHRRRCLELGADGYFTKPFSVEELAEKIAGAVGR